MQNNKFGSINTIILMAGNGTRMKSNMPKVFHTIGGLPMFQHIINTLNKINFDNNIIFVISQQEEEKFKQIITDNNIKNINYVIQEEKLGTGHATLCAVKSSSFNIKNKYTSVFYGDVPFISEDTIKKMFSLQKNYDLVVLGFIAKNQNQPYGRLFTGQDLLVGQWGKIIEIKEFKDLPREKPKYCNSGIYLGKTEIFKKLLHKIKNHNVQKEYYLTDIVELANQKGYKIGTYICDENEVIGINNKIELENAEQILQEKIKKKLMIDGITLLNKNSIYFSYNVKVGKNITIEPNVYIGLNVQIGNNCIIKAGSYLENIKIPDNTIIQPNSVLVK